jgi:hypothetical protein
MIKVFITGKGYTVEHNGNVIVKCNESLVPFKELLQHLGFDLSTNKVEIYDGEGENASKYETTNMSSIDNIDNIDDVIASMNATFVSPNLGKYRETFEDNNSTNIVTEKPAYVEEQHAANHTPKNRPVGSVDCPEEGNLIYVDGIQGVLSNITGGIGTVMTIYLSNDSIVVDNDDREDWDEDEDYDDNYSTEEENNILVELEEVPGHYFSWSLLRSQQSVLENKYGYKPVCKI